MRWTTGDAVRCPVLIGRTECLNALERQLRQAQSGVGGTVVLTGEAGVGKSRVVAEACRQAATSGFAILQGNCYEADRSLPFAPLVDLLRRTLSRRSPESLLPDLGWTAAELVKLSPELADLLPGVTAAPSGEPPYEKRRQFEALARALRDVADGESVLVVVEDLHWADEASLEFLAYLARRIAVPATPFLLLLTCRDEDAPPGLAHLLAELDRTRLATEIRLPPLRPAEVDLMLRAIFGRTEPVRTDFLQALSELTEGNPFFLEEVLTSLIAAGDIFYRDGRWDRKPLDQLRIPRTIRDAVGRRVTTLTPPSRDLLALAAVVGRHFDVALLRSALGLGERELIGAIRELIAAQLVVEESAERFAFRHALTREAVYTSLLALERRALHRQVVEAIERSDASGREARLSELASHAFQATAWAKALEYGQRAGERALARHAPRTAVELFTWAREAARALAIVPPLGLLRSRGQAYEVLGEFELARADHEEVLQSVRQEGDRQEEWQALLDLGFLWVSRDYARAGDYFRLAPALARDLGDLSLVARSLNRLGNWLVNVGQPREGRRYHEEARVIFEKLADRPHLAETLDLLGLATLHLGEVDRAVACYERAAEMFRELNDRRGLASGLTMLGQIGVLGYVGLESGAALGVAGAVRRGEEALAITREIGWRAGEVFAQLTLAFSYAAGGEYSRAFDAARASLALAEEIGHRQWSALVRGSLGGYYLDLLAVPLALRHLDEALAAARSVGSAIFAHQWAALLARAWLAQGELDRADAILAPALGPSAAEATGGERLVWLVRAEAALLHGDPALALAITDQLQGSSSGSPEATVNPLLEAVRGHALAALNRAQEAEAAFTTALLAAQASGIRPHVWRLHAALGRLYQSRKRLAEAAREFAAARATIAELAATVPDEPISDLGGVSLRAHFLRAAATQVPPPRPLTPLKAAKKTFGGLTAREREVAALIARGKTNREIAEALVVGEATVETHVGNILGKLGFGSRAQVAAWAVENGLAARPERT